MISRAHHDGVTVALFVFSCFSAFSDTYHHTKKFKLGDLSETSINVMDRCNEDSQS